MNSWLSHLCRSVLPAFVHLQPNIWFLFPLLTYPGTLPGLHMHPSAKMDLEVNASGKIKTHYGLALSPDLSPARSFSVHARCLPVLKREGSEIP